MNRRSRVSLELSLLLLVLTPARAASSDPQGEPAPFSPHMEVEAGYSRAYLSGNKEEWDAFHAEALFHLEPQHERISGRKFISARYFESQRFGLWDRDFGLGLSHPISHKMTGRIEASASPSYHYLPRWQVQTGVSQILERAWVGHLDYRHTAYRPNAVDQVSCGVDKYFSSFRAAYTFSWNAIPGEDSAFGNRIVLEHYLDPEAQNRIAIAFCDGHELENLGQNDIVKTRVHAFWFYGRQPLTTRVSIAWQMSFGEHSSYVQREVGIALRSSF